MTDHPRVLIIENNDVLRAMLFTILRHQPVAVDTAATADDALDKILSCDYSIIFIDVHLPDGQSEKFLNGFRERRPEATSYVIAVRDPHEEIEIDPRAVVAVLDKPLELDLLAEVVRECAFLVPRPADPLPCPPSDSDMRARFDRTSHLSN